MNSNSLLSIQQLSLRIGAKDILKNVTLDIPQKACVGIVGESGSGKTMAAKAVLGLAPPCTGEVLYKGSNLLDKPEKEMQKIRGREIAFVCQNPLTALNPTRNIESQLIEGFLHHEKSSKQTAKMRAVEFLDEMGFQDPRKILEQYPDQLSGGMRQRLVIAIALMCHPSLLIADEPTTALDVKTQDQILDLLEKCRHLYEMSVLLISHDLGVVAGQCDRVYIMEHGTIVDSGSTDYVFYESTHSYTRELSWKRM